MRVSPQINLNDTESANVATNQNRNNLEVDFERAMEINKDNSQEMEGDQMNELIRRGTTNLFEHDADNDLSY